MVSRCRSLSQGDGDNLLHTLVVYLDPGELYGPKNRLSSHEDRGKIAAAIARKVPELLDQANKARWPVHRVPPPSD